MRRDTLLDAARDELALRGWSAVSMSDIALAAGVGRGTLYKEIGTRDALARGLALAESDRLFGTLEAVMDADPSDPASGLLAALELFLRAVSDDPVVRAISVGDDRVLPPARTEDQPTAERTTARLRAAIVVRWPQVAAHDAALLCECVMRLAISFVALPARRAGNTAASLAGLLGPYIEQLAEQPDPSPYAAIGLVEDAVSEWHRERDKLE
jgi:AcrR family transcriptional regulator